MTGGEEALRRLQVFCLRKSWGLGVCGEEYDVGGCDLDAQIAAFHFLVSFLASIPVDYLN